MNMAKFKYLLLYIIFELNIQNYKYYSIEVW